jgi:hypothetical protein
VPAPLEFAIGHRPGPLLVMFSLDRVQLSAKVIGDYGRLGVLSPVAPFRRLSVRSADGNRVERFPRRATSAYQLDTFAAAVLPASRSRNRA